MHPRERRAAGGESEICRGAAAGAGAVKKLLITIDGPAGAGKTTASRALASRLGYRYIDTGALYRGVALVAQRRGILLRTTPA